MHSYRLFCLMTTAMVFPSNCFGIELLPGGSWVESSKQIKVTPLRKEGTDNDDDEELSTYKLSAMLRNRIYKWNFATVVFRKGDKFANKDGTFVLQDQYDREKDEKVTFEIFSLWLDLIIVNIPWVNFIWILWLRAEMKEMEADQKAQQLEMSKLQKNLCQALIDKDSLHKELTAMPKETGDKKLQEKEIFRLRKELDQALKENLKLQQKLEGQGIFKKPAMFEKDTFKG